MILARPDVPFKSDCWMSPLSTIVLNGDIQQSDLKGTSGLAKIIHLSKKHMLDVPVVEFGVDDIVRSGICAEWVKVFMKEGL